MVITNTSKNSFVFCILGIVILLEAIQTDGIPK